MNRFLFFICCFILLIAAGCSKKQATKPDTVSVEDFFPKSGDISGWTLTGNRWNASSSSELNQAIDGDEPVYTRNGFVEGMMREYEGKVNNASCQLELRIFDQGKSENVKVLFDYLANQLVNPANWAPAGSDEGKAEKTPLSQKILFREAKYFVLLMIKSDQNEALDILKTFAENVASKIG